MLLDAPLVRVNDHVGKLAPGRARRFWVGHAELDRIVAATIAQ
jgi:hypothetical protein